jgi:hypothetical protein
MNSELSLLSFLQISCDQDIINIIIYSENYYQNENENENITIKKTKLDCLDIKKYYKCNKNDIDCSICFEKVDCKEFVRKLNCNHAFHKKCIDRWLVNSIKNENSPSCALCRQIVNLK